MALAFMVSSLRRGCTGTHSRFGHGGRATRHDLSRVRMVAAVRATSPTEIARARLTL